MNRRSFIGKIGLGIAGLAGVKALESSPKAPEGVATINPEPIPSHKDLIANGRRSSKHTMRGIGRWIDTSDPLEKAKAQAMKELRKDWEQLLK